MRKFFIMLFIAISASTTVAAIAMPVTPVHASASRVVSHQPPAWFHWQHVSYQHLFHPCIVSWGGRLGSQTSKTITCSDGFAKTFTPATIALTSARCTNSYQHTVHTQTVSWSEVQWISDSCNYTFRGISECFSPRTGLKHTYVGGFVKRGGPASRASCNDSLPVIDHAGYDLTTPSGTTRHWYWSG